MSDTTYGGGNGGGAAAAGGNSGLNFAEFLLAAVGVVALVYVIKLLIAALVSIAQTALALLFLYFLIKSAF